MSCVRANKFAQQDKTSLEDAKKDLGDDKLDIGKKLGAAMRVLKIAEQHEKEKLSSLQDDALKKQKKKESYRDKVDSKDIRASKKQLEYFKSKGEALDTIKTLHEETKKEESLIRQIDEKTNRLAGIQEERRKRADVPTESRALLQEKLKEVNDQIKKQGRIETLLKKKAEVESLINEGPKEKAEKAPKEVSPEEKALIKEISDLKAQVKDTPWKKEALREAAIKNYSASLDRSAARLEEQLATGDFTSNRKYREQIKTPEVVEKQKRLETLKDNVRKAIAKIEYENRTPLQRSMDFLTDLKRFSILSGPKSIAKLTAASAEVALSRGITETAGYGLRAIPLINKIAKMAPTEGGRWEEAYQDTNAYWKGLIEGSKEIKGIISGKTSALDLKFGKGTDIPQNWMGLWGRLHEAVKNPTRVANYNMAYGRYLKWAERMGEDPHSEAVKQQAELTAFAYGNDSIFKSDNFVVNIYNSQIRKLEREGMLGKTIAFGLKQTLPIVRIPTNIIFQTFEYALGTLPATLNIIKAVNKGIDKISPEEADLIMRQLKRGSAGAFMIVVGAVFEENIGGIYMTGEEKGELEYGQIKFPWWDKPLPRNLLENPLFACLQIGASMSRYWKNHVEETMPWYEKGAEIAWGAVKTAGGLVEEAPFVKSMFEVEKIAHARDRLAETFAEVYFQPYIPAASKYVADLMDLEQPVDWTSFWDVANTAVAPKYNKRVPENVLQVMQESIPFLRNDIPLR